MNSQKLFLVSLFVISGFFFCSTLKAEAATLYYNAATNFEWTTLANWWTDPDFSTQALALPTTTDDVIIYKSVNSNNGPAITVKTLTSEEGGAFSAIAISTTDGAVFNDYGMLNANLTGNVIFNDTSFKNSGTIFGNASFYDSSKQLNGVVTGNACFSADATNSGTVNGTTTACSVSVPIITTGYSSTIGDTFEGLLGTIVETGGESLSARGFQYGLTTLYSATTTFSGEDVRRVIEMVIGGLQCNTTYHYRAFGTNSAGTSYGSDDVFTTGACINNDDSVLYGVDGAGGNPDPSSLFIIDKETGTKSSTVGVVGFNVTGLSFHPTTGLLYGVTSGSGANPRSLITISTSTGAGTYLGTIKNGSNVTLNIPDISFKSDGRLYGFVQGGGGPGATNDLYEIDITSCDGIDASCLATRVGLSSLSLSYGNAIAFDSDDNLYLFNDGDSVFHQLDPDTGLVLEEFEFSNPSPASGTYSLAAASFNENDVVYASRLNFGSPPTDIIAIDLDTNTIFSTGENNEDALYMDALAFYIPPQEPEPTPTPEPAEEPRRHRSGGGISIVRPPVIVTNASGTLSVLTDDLTILQNRINDLLAQIKAIQDARDLNSSQTLSSLPNLTLGSKGENVKALQTFLINQNLGQASIALKSVGATGYFGVLTKNALAEYQRIKGINPPLGFFGPLTRAYLKYKGF